MNSKEVTKNFLRDLEKGKKHERVVLEYVQRKYPEAHIKEGLVKEYDIWVPEVEVGIEVKSDEKSQETGNVVIEVEFAGKPSALSTTKADYWVIWDKVKYHWLKVEDIHKCIEDTDQHIAKFVGKGDKRAKKAYLLKAKTLFSYETMSTTVDQD